SDPRLRVPPITGLGDRRGLADGSVRCGANARSADGAAIRYTRGVTIPADAATELPRHRPTSRLLVIDPRDRILLLRVHEPRFEQPILWFTPGGGLDPGETFEQAAVRELWEETGIVAPLGPCVWRRRHVLRFVRDAPLLDL